MNHHTANRTRKAHIRALYEKAHPADAPVRVNIGGGIVSISDRTGRELERLTVQEANARYGKKKRSDEPTVAGSAKRGVAGQETRKNGG